MKCSSLIALIICRGYCLEMIRVDFLAGPYNPPINSCPRRTAEALLRDRRLSGDGCGQ